MERYQLDSPLDDDDLNPLLWSEDHPQPRFPKGLPSLQYSGHHDAPIDTAMLSGRQKRAAEAYGYI